MTDNGLFAYQFCPDENGLFAYQFCPDEISLLVLDKMVAKPINIPIISGPYMIYAYTW